MYHLMSMHYPVILNVITRVERFIGRYICMCMDMCIHVHICVCIFLLVHVWLFPMLR